MASKNYDDLLESFMNNSQQVYNDDKDKHEQNAKKLPSSYSTNASKDAAKKGGRTKPAKKPSVNNNSGVKDALAGVGKALLYAAPFCLFTVTAMFTATRYSTLIKKNIRRIRPHLFTVTTITTSLLRLQDFTVKKTVSGSLLTR